MQDFSYLDVIELAIAIIGCASGLWSLYLYHRDLSSQKTALTARVFSAKYSRKELENDASHDLNIEAEIILENLGKRNTTITKAFAEVRVGKEIPAIHSSTGEIVSKELEGNKKVVGPFQLHADESKMVNLKFKIGSVDPLTVKRFILDKTPMHSSVLQDPIIVDFTIRHTHGSLKGKYPVYSDDQFEQKLTTLLSDHDMKSGKPTWVERTNNNNEP